MSKEKTRAELHAEVADLKAKLENEVKHATEVRAEYANLDAAHKALKKEHADLEKKLLYAESDNKTYRDISEKNKKEVERLKKREEYLEGELKEKTELNEKQGERIQKYSESIERIRADRDKAQYIAADLLEHGVFHFLIVKYRNLRAK